MVRYAKILQVSGHEPRRFLVKDFLFLGSQSTSRQKLLKMVGIPFIVVPHSSDEQLCKGELSLEEYVMAIAHEKMHTLQLPNPHSIDKKYIHVLTADTLVFLIQSERIFGKPKNIEDAKNMLRSMRNEDVKVATGCCLNRYIACNGQWLLDKTVQWTASAEVQFYIDEAFVETFYDHEPTALLAAGGVIIDGYGQLFCRSIKGAYSTVIGLPLFDLFLELKKMDFNFN
jgi:septum formation protein